MVRVGCANRLKPYVTQGILPRLYPACFLSSKFFGGVGIRVSGVRVPEPPVCRVVACFLPSSYASNLHNVPVRCLYTAYRFSFALGSFLAQGTPFSAAHALPAGDTPPQRKAIVSFLAKTKNANFVRARLTARTSRFMAGGESIEKHLADFLHCQSRNSKFSMAWTACIWCSNCESGIILT